MKLVIRAHFLSVATLACLAIPTTWAAQPYSSSRLQPSGMSGNAPSRFTEQGASQSNTMLAEPEPVEAPSDVDAMQSADGEAWEGGPGGCSTCNDGWSNGRFQRGLWYGSVDYLLVRPRFSQAVAEERRTLVTNTNVSPNTSNLIDQSVQFPFKYQSSFRAALGYRLLDCGGDISVSYWRLTGNAQVSDGPAHPNTNNSFIGGQLENNPGEGQFFNATSGVTANIFDVDFAKCLSFGGPRNPCDACFCPRWDLRWLAGARIADISRFSNNDVTDASGNSITTGNINARFVGAGPRVGVQGRRYFGKTGLLSLYAKGSTALLIGNYQMSRVKTTPGNVEVPTDITSQFDTFSRLVPVTDIEIGGSWQVAPYTFISAGWFFQCWWDLGAAENVGGTNFGALDSSNILGFDGLFVRGEMLF